MRLLDDEVSELLGVLDASFPPVHEMTGAQARAAIAERRGPVANRADVPRTQDLTIPGPHGSLKVRLYFPHGHEQQALPVVVFFHGGGFVFCDIESHEGFCREMAEQTRSIVVSVAYRLAPEHPAPAAARDAYTALSWARENAATFGGDPVRVITAGDSAGGNLATVACVMSDEAGVPPAAGQVLLYPMLDPGCEADSYQRYATGYYNTRAAMQWYWQQYLSAGATTYPRHHVAPLETPDLGGSPPSVVVTAGLDPVRDDGEAYADALARDGVAVLHRRYAGLFHGFLTLASLRAARSARTLLWRDMRTLLAAAGNEEGIA